MPTTKYTDLATHLRSWGLKVQEVSGWQTRSSNWSKTFAPRGVVCHHTAGPTAGGNYPSYDTVLNGRRDLAGPLSQFGLGRDGTVIIFAGHRANHAGVGGPLVGIPEDSGNAYLWGIEAENSGTQAWPAVQLQAYYRLCAALATYAKAPFPASRVIGHKEWAPGRKVDPGGINMAGFRANVQKAIDAGKPTPTSTALPKTGPKIDWLGNPKYGMGPYEDGRWTRGPVPRHPLYLSTIYKAIAIETGKRNDSLDVWETAHRQKVCASLAYLVRLKSAKPHRSITNLTKQVQTLWLDIRYGDKTYGYFDRHMLDLLTRRQGWSFWDGPRSDNGIQ
jgi:hypothetical protein